MFGQTTLGAPAGRCILKGMPAGFSASVRGFSEPISPCIRYIGRKTEYLSFFSARLLLIPVETLSLRGQLARSFKGIAA